MSGTGVAVVRGQREDKQHHLALTFFSDGCDMSQTARTVRRTESGWCVRLDESSEVELFGCEWIPLPLTSEASFGQVIAHLYRQPHYAGSEVVQG